MRQALKHLFSGAYGDFFKYFCLDIIDRLLTLCHKYCIIKVLSQKYFLITATIIIVNNAEYVKNFSDHL
jgi:hypothetical protein